MSFFNMNMLDLSIWGSKYNDKFSKFKTTGKNMLQTTTRLLLAFILCANFAIAQANEVIKTTDIGNSDIGKSTTVCGYVAQVTNINNITFVNFDHNYPRQNFYFFINDGRNFNQYEGKIICGYGQITLHKGRLEIVNPTSIVIH